MDKNMEKNMGMNLHPGNGARPNNHKQQHFSQQKKKRTKTKKRPHPEAAARKRTGPTATSARLGDLRLILESTATDEELARKVKNATDELQAVVEALGDEGPTYLGIVDKVRGGRSGRPTGGRQRGYNNSFGGNQWGTTTCDGDRVGWMRTKEMRGDNRRGNPLSGHER